MYDLNDYLVTEEHPEFHSSMNRFSKCATFQREVPDKS